MYGELSRKLDSETTRHSSSSGSSNRRDEEHLQTTALKLVIVTVLTNTDATTGLQAVKHYILRVSATRPLAA